MANARNLLLRMQLFILLMEIPVAMKLATITIGRTMERALNTIQQIILSGL